jgi:hypothetical protein
MADAAPARGGFRGGFGGRGRGRGDRRGRGRGRRGGKEGDKEWVPVTKLGRLVKDGKIKSLEEIYLYSLPIKVRDTLCGANNNVHLCSGFYVSIIEARTKKSTMKGILASQGRNLDVNG